MKFTIDQLDKAIISTAEDWKARARFLQNKGYTHDFFYEWLTLFTMLDNLAKVGINPELEMLKRWLDFIADARDEADAIMKGELTHEAD